LSKYHAIESDAFPEGIRIESGPAPTIDLLIEARQGNKVVTRVTGLEAFGIFPDQFAKDCQKRFACSATVNQITGQKQKVRLSFLGRLLGT
jgi:translation initiation factor 2D